MSISRKVSNLLSVKGAATAAFLLVLLVAVLPFFFSGGGSNPSPLQVVTDAPNEKNAANWDGAIQASTELATPTQFFSVTDANSTERYPLVPSSNLTGTVQAEVSLKVQRNPIALGDAALFTMTVLPLPPSSNDHFSNLTLSIMRPDGTAETLGPFQSESNGRQSVYYTPDLIGSYQIQAAYGGQFFTSGNVTYLSALSPITTLIVSPDEIPRIERTWIVDDDGPADFHTIQAAINAADDGDIIKVLYGVYREHVVVNKTLTVQSQENAVVDASGDTGSLVKPTIARWNGITLLADSSAVSGFTVRNGANSGIEIRGDDCKVQNNTCEGSNGRGISLYGDKEGYTDILTTQPRYNLIIGNTVRGCGTGLFAKDTHENTVIQNVFETNQYAGIYLFSYSSGNVLTNNTVSRSTHTWSGEGGYGIILGTGAEDNLFTGNTISNNPTVGLAIDIFGLGYPLPHSNEVYHNNFYGNAIQAYDKGTDNVWDNGYPSGGNYWSNYHGVDADGDGIGDTTYVIDVNNRDRYPLMSPFSPDTTTNVLEPTTWTVDDDFPANFRTIQEAINAASSGDTIFVRSGTYQENPVVNKSVSLIGENVYQTIINAKTSGKVVTVSVSRVTIVGFRIQGTGPQRPTDNVGVCFVNPSISFSNVSHNIISGNVYGISVRGSQNNIDSNYFLNNLLGGIYLNASSNNLITRNNLTGGKTGIFIAYSSSNNLLRDNKMTGSELNLHIISDNLQGLIQNIDTSNTVNGKPVYYWISKRNQVVPLDAGAVYLINCSNIMVQDLELVSTGQGVLLAYTSNCTVQRSHISSCDNGVRIQSSTNNLVSSNDLYASSCGVALVNSSGNTVVNNNINGSLNHAVFVFLSSGNRFYHNNLSNKIQVWTDDYASMNNVWDNGYPSGGNHWSDYNGTDLNSDGIGDTPYIIVANNKDRYPLMAEISISEGIARAY